MLTYHHKIRDKSRADSYDIITSMKYRPYIPNLLSLFRLCTAILIGGLIFIPAPIWTVQALVILGIVSDKLDGSLARLWKVESDLGKRLESVIDPTFGFLSGIYIFLYTDIPSWLFWLAILLTSIGVGGRIFIKLYTGKFFYEKSQITRIGVGLTFTILIIYLFAVPYRDWILWPFAIWTTFGVINYCRMMILFTLKHRRPNDSVS